MKIAFDAQLLMEAEKTGIGYVADGLWATKLNGLWDDSGHWYLFDGGVVQKNYTGLYQDTDQSWWLIRNGMADFSYDGLYCDQNVGWMLLFDGRSTADYGDVGARDGPHDRKARLLEKSHHHTQRQRPNQGQGKDREGPQHAG